MTRAARLRTSPLAVQAVVFGAFAAPIGMLGAAWPEGAERVDRSTAALGLLITGYGLGRLTTSATAIAVLRRTAIGPATAVACTVLAAAEVAIALTRSYAALVVAATVVGLASGVLDSLGNRYQTAVREVRQSGLVTGAYGVGATLFPALLAVTSWPVGFLAGAGVALVAAVAAVAPGITWPEALSALRGEHRVERPADRAPVPAGVRRAATWSLAAFALFCTVEIVTGNWAATYLQDGRGASDRSAALAVSGFWGGITVGRLLLGRLAIGPRNLLAGAAVTAAVLLLAVPVMPRPVAIVTYPLVGLALSPLFPTLMATTADRVGAAFAGRLGGYQLVAMNLGGTGLSALVGVAVARTDARAIGVFAAAMVLVGIIPMLRVTRLVPARPHPGSEPAVVPR